MCAGLKTVVLNLWVTTVRKHIVSDQKFVFSDDHDPQVENGCSRN